MDIRRLKAIAGAAALGLLVSLAIVETQPARAVADPAAAAAAAPIPSGPDGALIRYGRQLIAQTRKYARSYVKAGMDCSACHVNAGTVAHGGSLLGVYAKFPQWNARSKRFITLGDRLDECFMYSMNGRPPPPYSREIVALTAYIAFLSHGSEVGKGFPGQDFVTVNAPHPPNAASGAKIYVAQCQMCHGASGAGNSAANFPPLWGSGSFNNGAGMNTKMAAFVKANMPFGRGGSLTDQEATDVSAYVLSHPRPQFNQNRPIVFPPEPAKFF